MLYFEIRDALRFLTLEEKGQLLDAVLEYGMFGTVPEFAGILGMAWAFVKPKLDVDAERYDNAVLQRRYAAAVREAKRNGTDFPSFSEWKSTTDIDRCNPLSVDNEPYPTTTPTTTTAAKGSAGEKRREKQVNHRRETK